MLRARFLLLLIVGLGVLGASPVMARPVALSNAGAQATQAADALLAAWRGKRTSEFKELAQRSIPDRFRVVLHMTLRSRDDEERRGSLLSFASHHEKAPQLVATARHWAEASAEDVAIEREQEELRAATERSLLDRSLESTDALRALEAAGGLNTASVASWLVAQLRFRILSASRRRAPALELAGRLLAHADSFDWHHLAVDVHFECGRLHRATKDRAAAARSYTAAATAARRMGHDVRERMALQFAVVLSMNRGNLAERYALQHRLVELMDAQAPESVRARMQLWLIDAEIRLDALTDAWARATALHKRAKELDDEALAFNTEVQLLRVRAAQGRTAEALAMATAVHARREQMDDPNDRARAATTLCVVYRRVGQLELALELCQQTLAEAPKGGALVMTATAPVLAQIAAILGELGRTDESRAAWARAAAVYREHDQAVRLIFALRAQAFQELAVGDVEAAEKLAAEAHEVSKRASPRAKGLALSLLAKIALYKSDGKSALELAEDAIEALTVGEIRPAEFAHFLATRGRAQHRLGQHAESVRTLERATRLLLDVSAGLGERHGLGLRASAHEVAHAGFLASVELAKVDRSGAAVRQAWWFREAGNALLLAESVGQPHRMGRRRLTAEERGRLQTALDTLTRAHAHAVVVERREPAGSEKHEEAVSHLGDAHAAYHRLASTLESESRHARGQFRGEPIPLRDFQAGLPVDTAALAFVEAGGTLHAFGIRGERVVLRVLGTAQEIRDDVRAWRDLVSAPGGPTTKVASRLYRTLVSPFSELVRGRARLVVMPDGPIAGLPLSALVSRRPENGEAARYVLDDHVVSYLPSASVGRALHGHASKTGRGVCCFGDPAPRPRATVPAGQAPDEAPPQFVRLRGARAEVEAVSGCYPEEYRRTFLGDHAGIGQWDASFGNADVPRVRALHIACHGRIDVRRPYLSGLVLAGGEVLTVEHIHRHRVPADLVVLSACNTAVGTRHRGEGVLGLTRGFFQAGAPRVVVSAWAVSDKATGQLMTTLHEAWAAGSVKADDALCLARRAFRQQKGPRAHPYYWAPFVLWGTP